MYLTRSVRRPSLLRRAAASTLLATLAGAGACTEEPRPRHSIDVALSAGTLAVVQGDRSTATVTITRGGGFDGAVDLSVRPAPGVTASFDPGAVPRNASTSTLALRVDSSAAPGTYPLAVVARGDGVPADSAVLTLTVEAAPSTPAFALALPEAPLTVAAGTTDSVPIAIDRADGFDGAVTLDVTGAAAGVSTTVTPNPAAGDAATLRVTAAPGAAPGTSVLTVRGSAAGAADQTVALTVSVPSAPPPGQTRDVALTFCADNAPLWVAVQDGSAGWRRVTANAANAYAVTLASPRAGVAAVTADGAGGHALNVTYAAAREWAVAARGGSLQGCTSGRKSVSGSVAGVGADQYASVTLGPKGTAAGLGGRSTFTIDSLPGGALDLVATRAAAPRAGDAFALTVDRMIIRRGVDVPSGATLDPLDFASGDAFAPVPATVTIAGLGGDSAFLGVGYTTARNNQWLFSQAFLSFDAGTAATRTYYGVPEARQAAGDLHQLFVMAGATAGRPGGDRTRATWTYTRAAADAAVALGPELGTPTVTAIEGGAYQRFRAVLPAQREYNQLASITFSQEGRSASIGVTAAYADEQPAFDLVVPDLSGVDGFRPEWGLRPGDVRWEAIAFGGSTASFFDFFTGVPAEGATARMASRSSGNDAGAAPSVARLRRLRAPALPGLLAR
jgi:hypothetical protein